MNVNFPFLSPDVGNGQMTEYRCNECNFPFLPPDVEIGQMTEDRCNECEFPFSLARCWKWSDDMGQM